LKEDEEALVVDVAFEVLSTTREQAASVVPNVTPPPPFFFDLDWVLEPLARVGLVVVVVVATGGDIKSPNDKRFVRFDIGGWDIPFPFPLAVVVVVVVVVVE